VATPPPLEKRVRGVEVGGKPLRLVFRVREGWWWQSFRLMFWAREEVVADSVDGGKTPPCCTSSEGEDGAG